MEILTHDWRVELLRKHEIPFVMIGRCADTSGLHYVDVDIAQGVQDAVRHLYALGHRQIGLVTLAPVQHGKEYGYTTWAVNGYQAACAQFGLPSLRCAVDFDTKDSSSVVLQMLDQSPGITAMVVPQESGIASVFKALQVKGLRIQEDISIMGLLDNNMSELLTPPLSTISFPSHEMGYEAMKILIGQMNGVITTPQQILLRPGLVIRGSVGPVRVRSTG
jgi:DNA-binding LacI/PurR family transcriptional regulator